MTLVTVDSNAGLVSWVIFVFFFNTNFLLYGIYDHILYMCAFHLKNLYSCVSLSSCLLVGMVMILGMHYK